MKLKLVENWKEGWKWISTNSMVLVITILSSWGAMPEAFQQAVPLPVLMWVAVAVLVLGVIGRFVDQGTGSK